MNRKLVVVFFRAATMMLMAMSALHHRQVSTAAACATCFYQQGQGYGCLPYPVYMICASNGNEPCVLDGCCHGGGWCY
jgi:hypothetical protein